MKKLSDNRDYLLTDCIFLSGVFGSGICILSRYPIHDVMFHKWPLNGYVHKIQHADWFGGKGVGLCKINIRKMNINIYVAHVRLFNALSQIIYFCDIITRNTVHMYSVYLRDMYHVYSLW